MVVPPTAMAIAPIQHKTTVQIVKLDAAPDVPNNAVPIVQRAAKPLVQAPAPTDVAHFAAEPASLPVAVLVLMSLLVQVAPLAHVLLLAKTIALGHARWLAVRIVCRVVSPLQNENSYQYYIVFIFNETVNCIDAFIVDT